jgi:hypothetical protein
LYHFYLYLYMYMLFNLPRDGSPPTPGTSVCRHLRARVVSSDQKDCFPSILKKWFRFSSTFSIPEELTSLLVSALLHLSVFHLSQEMCLMCPCTFCCLPEKDRIRRILLKFPGVLPSNAQANGSIQKIVGRANIAPGQILYSPLNSKYRVYIVSFTQLTHDVSPTHT